MIALMTRVLLGDMTRPELTTRWLLWLGTPVELRLTHEVWREAVRDAEFAAMFQVTPGLFR